MTSTFVGVDAGYENRWEAEKIALELHDTLLTTARTVVVHEVDSHFAMSFLLPVPPSDAVVNTLVAAGFRCIRTRRVLRPAGRPGDAARRCVHRRRGPPVPP